MSKKEYLTSRQRVIKAVKHEKIDRVPIDLGVHFSTGISVFAYHNLRKHLGLSTDNIELIDCVQMLARVEDDIINRFHIDTILLNPPFERTRKWNVRGEYNFIVPKKFAPILMEDGSYKMNVDGADMYMPNNGFFFDGAWEVFYEAGYEEKLDAFAKRAEIIHKETDKYTLFMGFEAFFSDLDFACDMLTDPEVCIERNKKLLESNIAHFNNVNKKMGKYINCIEVISDLGTQNGLMCTPKSYEEICYPFLKQFCNYVHNNSDMQIFLHSCGSVYDLMPMIVDAGIDIINPVQISAAKMSPDRLKKEFGDKICFWGGGCDTQSVLNNALPREVKTHVKSLIELFKENSGYVFNQVHNIMGNISPENIVALFDTAYENSFYE